MKLEVGAAAEHKKLGPPEIREFSAPCHSFWKLIYCFKYVGKDFIHLFLERREAREKERDRNVNRLPLARTPTRDGPTTQACALTRNQTVSLLFRGPTLSQLSHAQQGSGNLLRRKTRKSRSSCPTTRWDRATY